MDRGDATEEVNSVVKLKYNKDRGGSKRCNQDTVCTCRNLVEGVVMCFNVI